MSPTIILSIIIFLYGIVIGSFLNVVIYRVPKHENIVVTGSHCMSCGYRLKWYDMIPIASYLVLGGRCRKCGAKLSVQYPIIEAANGVLYVLVFLRFGCSIDSLVYCLLFSTLLSLSVIDFRTYEIPLGCNIMILALGLIHLFCHLDAWLDYCIGALCVSGFLLLLYVVSKGRAIGGGDVKLMAACGLILGWKGIIVAFLFGCILGSIIHLLRMKISGEGRVLAMGPYLSAGVALAVLVGEQFLTWYLGLYA